MGRHGGMKPAGSVRSRRRVVVWPRVKRAVRSVVEILRGVFQQYACSRSSDEVKLLTDKRGAKRWLRSTLLVGSADDPFDRCLE